MSKDTIYRQEAIDALAKEVRYVDGYYVEYDAVISETDAMDAIKALSPAQQETCEGCKHFGKWENEVEYGYPSPCTRCKRRVNDNYER